MPLTRFRLDNLITNMYFDTDPLRSYSESLPFSLEDGVEETLKWFINNK